jgi:hypothetical protein
LKGFPIFAIDDHANPGYWCQAVDFKATYIALLSDEALFIKE